MKINALRWPNFCGVILFVFVLTAISVSGTLAQDDSKPKSVMVTDINASGILPWWQGKWDIGGLFSNTMIGPLSRTPSWEVVERARMTALFDEQGLTQSERFSQSAVTKIGRLLGADYILFGDLQDFSRKKSGMFVKETSVSIRLSARLVSVATGKVFKSVEVEYLSPKEKDYFGPLTKSETPNPNDPEFVQSMFGKAITQAAFKTVSQLTGEAGPQNASPVAPEKPAKSNALAPSGGGSNVKTGLIADVSGNSVVINIGTSKGVKVGAIFTVLKVVREVKNPETGAIILRKTEEIARIKITDAQADGAEGTVISGDAAALKVGQEVVKVD